jgi:hypothetical protein
MRHAMMAQTAGLLAVALAACSGGEPPAAGDQASPAPQASAAGPVGHGGAGLRPVMLTSAQGDPDPCALAMINDPPSGPEQGAVMVFGAATTDLDFVDTLMHTDKVWVCETIGDMHGIVYPDDGEKDCQLAAPRSGSAAYRGPCRTGWVKQEWVEIIAG